MRLVPDTHEHHPGEIEEYVVAALLSEDPEEQREALAEDVGRIRSYPLLQKGVSVAGAIYNVSTGKLEPVDC